jgi:SPP1 family predicted phage head-tail adaptor
MAQRTHLSPAGDRREAVTVEVREVSSGGGFPVETWTPLLTVGMEKVDLIGNEAFRADQMSARYDARFLSPYTPALDPEVVDVPATQRLVHRGRQYDIVTAAILGRFEGIEYHAMVSTKVP